MPQIILDQFYLGQNQDNPLVSGNNTLTHMIGCSPHEQLGIVGSGPSAAHLNIPGGITPPTAIVPYSETKVYMFIGGQLHKYNIGANTLTLIGSTSGNVTDAIYFDGYVYYIHGDDFIGRVNVSTDTITNNWDSLLIPTSPNEKRNPMYIIAGDLYIGNEYYIALIDSTHTFVGNALDIPKDYRVSALTNIGNELLIGTENKLGFPSTKLFRWNTWSESFSSEASVDIQTVAYFLQDNGDLYFVGCTPNAKIFAYNEPYPVEVTMIPSTVNNPVQRANSPIFTQNHVARWRGRTFFPLYGSNNEYPAGVYTFHASKKGLSQVISTELLAPVNNASTTITTVASIGRYFFFGYSSSTDEGCAMATLQNGGAVHDQSTVYTSYIAVERDLQKDFTVTISYRGILDNAASMVLEAETNYSENWDTYTLVKDIDRGIFYTAQRVAGANTVRFRITLNNGSVNPIFIENIILDFA